MMKKYCSHIKKNRSWPIKLYLQSLLFLHNYLPTLLGKHQLIMIHVQLKLASYYFNSPTEHNFFGGGGVWILIFIEQQNATSK